MDLNERAEILVQSLPYIQHYNGKIIVVKYGGNAMISDELRETVINDIVLMKCIGFKPIVVHGGGPYISSFLDKLGEKSEFINGLRYTDKKTMEVVQMVLGGKVNKDLVTLIEKAGGKSIGLCGLDGSLLKAKKLESEVDLGYVGEVTSVNTEAVTMALDAGYIPVIGSMAIGEDGNDLYNINADTCAAKRLHEIPKLTLQGVIKGGMIPKIQCCVESVRMGVERAHIIDGRVPHALLLELFSNDGIGTMIY